MLQMIFMWNLGGSMKLNKTVSLALAVAMLLNTTAPTFANSLVEANESISWTARAKKLAGIDVTHYADEKARAVAGIASSAVRNKLHEVFFKDNDRYGIDAEGRHVTIFTNKSGLLNNLFKKVTGADLDDSLRSVLPLGGLYVNTLRQKLDKVIVDEVLGSLVGLGVEEVIYRSITGAYSIGAEKLQDMTANFTRSLQNKPKSDAQAALEQTYTTIKQSKLDVVDTKEDEKDTVKSTAAKVLADESEEEITINKVIGYYKNKFLAYIDGILKETMISAISSAAKKIGTAVADATINVFKGPSTVTGALVGYFVNPTVGLVTGLTGFVTGLYQDQIKDYAGTQAEARARKVANSTLQSKNIIDYKVQYSTKVDVIDGVEFEIVDEVDHSISAWAAQKMERVTSVVESLKKVATDAQQKIVETAENVRQVLAEVDVEGGTKQAAQYLNKTYGGYDPSDILANIRPLTSEEQAIYAEADKRVPFPPQSIVERFGNLTESQIKNLSGVEGEAYDELVEDWQDEYDAAVDTIKRERAQAKKDQEPKTTSVLGTVKGWFGW